MEKQVPPLAYRLRPVTVDELIGQEEAAVFIRNFIEGKKASAMLWGPPGTGKSSVAGIIEQHHPDSYYAISAVTSGIQEIRKVTGQAGSKQLTPIVFIDEIHRFNKVQQDSLLPFVENGSIILIGATTENPSFSVTSPLLSRLRVIVFKALESGDIENILLRAIAFDPLMISLQKTFTDECIHTIAQSAHGDARAALNLLELAATTIDKDIIDLSDLQSLADRPLYHDRSGENHYDLISAFHKSVRAGDADASVYWLGRMLEGGEDRLFILRRMIRIASEDIGMAEPNALRLVISARDAFTAVGSPEGELALYQAAVYLACAPKSNALYLTEKRVRELIKKTGTPGVPLHLRNAPTRLMRDLGYAKGYIYAHDDPQGSLDLNYMPESIADERLYIPKGEGFEKRIKEIMNARKKAAGNRPGPYRKTS
ncbi:MAG: replication-associated recombination protein A [Deltaproteobacteria bacterium]|nr:replication-associated recombination protein A [Deltaproteobacteria bacterium]